MMTYQKSLERLIKGNNRFVDDELENILRDSNRREALIEGQEPYAVILGCADSRVVPELIFDTCLGELFAVRVAGNIANSGTIASIEFAVNKLKTKLIVVLGHQNCGAITAAIKGGDNGPHLNRLVDHILPAISCCGEHPTIEKVAIKNAELTVTNLIDKSKIIKSAVDTGEVKVVAAYYHLKSGKVSFL